MLPFGVKAVISLIMMNGVKTKLKPSGNIIDKEEYKMSFNSANLKNVRVALETALKGATEDLSAYAAMKLKKITVDAGRGVVPVTATAMLIGDSKGQAKFVAGSEIPEGDAYINYIQYECTKFGRKFTIDVLDAEELNSRDILKMTDFSMAAARHGLSDLDRELAAILKAQGSAANNTLISTEALSAGEEFNNYDSATSNPQGKIQQLIDDTLGGNTIYLGKDVANALRQHPQFSGDNATARSGAGKMMPYGDFADSLMAIFGFEHVIIDGTYYSTNGSVQKLASAQPLAGVCAVGHFDNVVLVERQPMLPKVWEDEATTAVVVASWGSFDLVVGDQGLTKSFSNTLE